MTPALSLLGLALLALDGDPAATVDRLHRALETRDRAAVATVVAETHAWDVLATAAGGPELDDAVRAELEPALVELVTTRRLALLPDGARFGESTVEHKEGGAATVVGTMVEADDDVVPLEVGLVTVGDAWRIASVSLGERPLLDLAAELGAARAEGGDPVAAVRAAEARHLEEPAAVVARLQAGLIEAMKRGDALDLGGRSALLEPLIVDTHDLEAVVRLSVGGRWDEATAEDRDALLSSFRELSVITYAARFHEHKGESFEVEGEETTRRGGIVVKSRLTKADGKTVAFDYQMRRAFGRWKVLNIVVDGASDLAIKRAEYGKVLERGGFSALIAELAAQVARYEAGGSR